MIWTLAFLFASHLFSGRALAQAPLRTSSLSWVRLGGAERCIGSADLARAVESRLDRDVFVSAADAELAIEGRVEGRAGQWAAFIELVGAEGQRLGERALESEEESCDALGEIAALTIALMIDPLTAPEPEPESEPPVEPATLIADAHAEPRAAMSPGPETAESQALSDSAERWRLEVDGAIVGGLALAPTPTLGVLGAIILLPAHFVPLVVEGAVFPFSRADNGDGRADFLVVHAGLQICPLNIERVALALHGCLGVDGGSMVVIGDSGGLFERARVIGQAHAAVRVHWDVSELFTLRAGLHFLVPFRHEPFLADFGGIGTQTIYQPEPIAGMLDLGVGIHVH